MTYDQILTLHEIIKHGSFKAASQAMHKSQPSLSMAIKKLEEEFSIKLFNRDQYRPVLTNQGREFYQKSLGLIDEFQKLETLAQEMGAGLESEIKICVDAIFPIQCLSEVLKHFFAPHLSVSLNLNTDVIDGVIANLFDHKVDLAFGPDFNLDDTIEKVPFINVQMLPIVGKKYKDLESLAQLKALPQIVVSSSKKDQNKNVSRGISSQFWYTTDFSMKRQLIQSDLGWGHLPEHQIKHQLNTDLFEVKNIETVSSFEVPMYLLRSKKKVMGPNTKRLWEYLKSKS